MPVRRRATVAGDGSRTPVPLVARPSLRVTVAVLLLFTLTRGWLLFGFQPQASDTSVYFSYACRAFDLGETPYAGDLTIEFPPAAWWVMASAYAISGDHVTAGSSPDEIAASRAHYMRTFRGQMAVFDVAAFAFLLLTVRRQRPEWFAGAGLTYIVCTTILAHPLYDRLDTGLLMVFMAAAYCLARGAEDGRRATWWTTGACALLGFGIAYKIIPILVLPFVLLAEWMAEGGWRKAGMAAAGAALGVGLPLFIQFLLSGPGVFDLIGFHVDRGIQLESLFATVLAVGALAGAPIRISLWEGGADLTGAWAPALKVASSIILGLFLAGLVLVLRRHHYDRRFAYRVGFFAVVGAVILSKVLSPQYLIWALPLGIVLTVEKFSPDRRGYLAAGLLVMIASLTTWVFPYHYFGFGVSAVGLEVPDPSALLSPSAVSLAALGVRNLLYLVCVILIA
jgi:hypothetical protein